jgi:hypothetical protein
MQVPGSILDQRTGYSAVPSELDCKCESTRFEFRSEHRLCLHVSRGIPQSLKERAENSTSNRPQPNTFLIVSYFTCCRILVYFLDVCLYMQSDIINF